MKRFRCPTAVLTVVAALLAAFAPTSAAAAAFGDRGWLSVDGTFVETASRLVSVRPTPDGDAYVLVERDAQGNALRETRVELPTTPGRAGPPTTPFQYGDFAFPAGPGAVYLRWENSIVSVPINRDPASSLSVPDCPGCPRAYVTRGDDGALLVTRGIDYPGSGAEIARWGFGDPGERTLFRNPLGGSLFANNRTVFAPVGDGIVVAASALTRFDRQGSEIWQVAKDSLHIADAPISWGLVARMPDGSLRVAGTVRGARPTLAVGAFSVDGERITDFGSQDGFTVVPDASVFHGSIKALRDGSFLVAFEPSGRVAPGTHQKAYTIVKFDPSGRLDTSFGGPLVSRGTAPGMVRVPFTLAGSWTYAVTSEDERSFQLAESPNGDVLVSMRIRDLCAQSPTGAIPSSQLRTRVIRIPRSGAEGMHLDRSGNLYTLPRSQRRFVGTAKCDLVQSFGGNVDIRTSSGRDVVNVLGSGTMRIATGPGNDLVDGPYRGRATILGGPGNDVLRAGRYAPSHIVGGTGRDVVVGSRYSDVLDVVDGRGGDIVSCHDSKRIKGSRPDRVRIDRGDRTIDCKNVTVVRARGR